MYQKCVSRFFYTLSPILLHILKASDCALPRGAPPRRTTPGAPPPSPSPLAPSRPAATREARAGACAPPTPVDIFIWLTCHGNEELARAFWPMCEMPIHMALLGKAAG